MTAENLLTLGQRAKNLRLSRPGLTADDAAAAIGIARATLSSIENGHDLPGRETLFAIASFYGVSTDFLRNGPPPAAAPKPGDLINDPEEAAWIGLWRGMTGRERSMMLASLTAIGAADAAA